MPGLINSMNPDPMTLDVDFVEGARILREAPISRERLIEQLQQQGPIDAVMPDQDDALARVPFKHEPQPVRRPDHEVL